MYTCVVPGEEAEARAEAAARSAALAKQQRIRAREAEMRETSEAKARVAQLENEQAELVEKVGSAAHEIHRLRQATETEQARTQELRKEKAAAEQPFGRLIDPAEVARAVTFLSSSDSGMMTGSVIQFDQSVWGGYSFAPPTPEEPMALPS